ncbi:MAG TPA: tRNA (adenosine(37)-N6)-threonylcarbamoyltransferase complex transferase subunit TsaD [Nitrospiria bacterium]|nr:tRNA (adenosine(37)-N6)-threonylcarbamoyltransferase complex transferase subunit TsaD [Nitrospiria bacterium]
MDILGIETSCDETAVAVVRDGTAVQSSLLISQSALHSDYGGVVPELASRHHLESVVGLTRAALREAGVAADALGGIAVTTGPGLIGALAIGVAFAKGLAYSLGCPLAGVNHLEGHLLSILLDRQPVAPPFIALIASGGHTNLYAVDAIGSYRLLGRTRDDAAGEAFDKAAKMLGLGYPGGPVIDRLAASGRPDWIHFPRGMAGRTGPAAYEFSFSGLKTALARHLDRHGPPTPDTLPHLAASFQAAIVDVLVEKTLRAAEDLGVADIVVAGGVAANRALRKQLQEEGAVRGFRIHVPPPRYCTDNGAMIAAAGYYRLRAAASRPPIDLALGPVLEWTGDLSVSGPRTAA